MVVRCKCGVPAKVKKSWTHENPGRRFYTCKFLDYYNEEEGCGFFGWHDRNQEAWQKVVINDLILEKRMVEHEIRVSKKELQKAKDMAAECDELKFKKSNVMVKRNGFVFGALVGGFFVFFLFVIMLS